MNDRLHVYKRPNSRYWQCSTFLAGRNRRKSTKESNLSRAIAFAEDWYLDVRGKQRAGTLRDGKTFRTVSKHFLREYEVITDGQRSPSYVDTIHKKIRVHLDPYFGDMLVSEISAGTVQEYRMHRAENSRTGKPPARSTIKQELVVLRHVLKTAQRHRWLPSLPDLSTPYKTAGKVVRRAWFSPEEYRRLYQATRKRARQPLRNRYRWHSEQLHDYVLFMANTGLRPDEAARLEHRDVAIVVDGGTEETILEIEVRGKRGLGYCKSTTGAVTPYRRLVRRNNPKATDLLFPEGHRGLFNRVLRELDLKVDRDGQRRTAYSLRHTYICMRLMEGADIYQIAKNCRTSVEMIETFYAAHIKNTLDAAAINVRRSKPRSSTKRVKGKPRGKVSADKRRRVR
jgi:integrase